MLKKYCLEHVQRLITELQINVPLSITQSLKQRERERETPVALSHVINNADGKHDRVSFLNTMLTVLVVGYAAHDSVSKSVRTVSITKYMLIFGTVRSEAT
jgi:hypothetical protein